MINNTNAPATTTPEEHAKRLQIIADAYAPEDCDECEGRGGTCWECAADALEEAGFKVISRP